MSNNSSDRNSEQRIPSIEPPYSESVQAAFDVVMPEGVPPLNIFRVVGNNERVLSRMVKGGLLDRGSITIADRELVILRACANCKAEYEWGVHVAAFAATAGLTDEQVNATLAATISNTVWSSEQQALLAMVDELHQSSTLSDELWERLNQHYSTEQLVELVMLAGLYHAVSFIVNGFRIQPEEFAAKFPKAQ